MWSLLHLHYFSFFTCDLLWTNFLWVCNVKWKGRLLFSDYFWIVCCKTPIESYSISCIVLHSIDCLKPVGVHNSLHLLSCLSSSLALVSFPFTSLKSSDPVVNMKLWGLFIALNYKSAFIQYRASLFLLPTWFNSLRQDRTNIETKI